MILASIHNTILQSQGLGSLEKWTHTYIHTHTHTHTHRDRGMSEGPRRQRKQRPVARAETFRTKDDVVLLDYNPKCKVNIPTAIPM